MTTEFDDLDLAKTISGDGQVVLAGRYRVVRELGRGGMGVVYLVADERLEDRPAAIKMLPAVLSRNPRAVVALKKEALLAMQLSHPHIVTLRGFEQCDEGAFLVMDYVDGCTLEQALADRDKLAEEEVIRVLGPIAEALDYAHSRKVIHRDVKPSNIIRDADGWPFIMDFGVAREMKDTFTRATGQGTSGTLPYMSPEQLRGQGPTPAQDIYSLAATGYECLTGHPPFWRGNIEYQIVNEPVAEPLDSTLRLAGGIARGLSKDPAERPKTCLEVLGLRPASRLLSVPRARMAVGGERPGSPAKPANRTALPLTKSPARLPAAMVLDFGGGVTMEFAQVPAGSFIMGSPPEEQEAARRGAEQAGVNWDFAEEGPQHEVAIRQPFCTSVCPVTRGQFAAFAQADAYRTEAEKDGAAYAWDGRTWNSLAGTSWRNPGFEQTDDHPAVCISLHDADAFCQWLGGRTGRAVRLPTEAQWEYACRAGASSSNPSDPVWSLPPMAMNGDWRPRPGRAMPFSFGDDEEALGAYAWYARNSGGTTHPVGRKEPNPWGLCDVHGQVWEWCRDWYGNYPAEAVADPTGPADGTFHILRGGSWVDDPRSCRSAVRNWSEAGRPSFSIIGFRVVVDVNA